VTLVPQRGRNMERSKDLILPTRRMNIWPSNRTSSRKRSRCQLSVAVRIIETVSLFGGGGEAEEGNHCFLSASI
jgi:hypothetical protein